MEGFGHIGLTVRDVERSLRFYEEVVGMRASDLDRELNTTPNETTQVEPGSELITVTSDAFDQLTNAHGTSIKYVNMRLPGGDFRLQLVEYIAGGDGQLELSHARAGTVHMNFYVEDVDAKYKELVSRGDVDITSAIVQITPSMRSFYVADPDGVPIEFLQATPND